MPSGILKRGLNEYEEMNVIGRLAANKAATLPEFTPIKLVLKEPRAFFISSCDVFVLNTTQNQRGKDVKSVDVLMCSVPGFRQRVAFVEDPDSYECYAYIPKTEHNMKLLASHLGEFWDIEDKAVLDEVVELAKGIKKVRDTDGLHAPVSGAAPTKQPEIERLREENATLKAREGLDPRQRTNTVEADIRIRKAEKEKAEAEAKAAQMAALLEAYQAKESEPKDNGAKDLKAAAKEALLADTEFMDALKAQNERWWLSKDYRDALNAKMDELKGAEVAVN